jgi:hypothetical protein
MIFIPFFNISIEELPNIYQKLLLILRLPDRLLLKYKSEVTIYVENALECFVYEQVLFDENLVLCLIHAYYRLKLLIDKADTGEDILHWIYYAILAVKLGQSSLLKQSKSFCNLERCLEFIEIINSDKNMIFRSELEQIKLIIEENTDLNREQNPYKDESFFSTIKNESFNQKLLSAFAASREYEDELVDNENLLPDTNSNRSIQLDSYSKKYLPHYLENSQIFHKNMRKSKERKELLAKLSVTDEQIEGWSLVFERNPHKNALINLFLEGENSLSNRLEAEL